eukprot:Clim_evm67s119 gene=Clim_evmTU67s119
MEWQENLDSIMLELNAKQQAPRGPPQKPDATPTMRRNTGSEPREHTTTPPGKKAPALRRFNTLRKRMSTKGGHSRHAAAAAIAAAKMKPELVKKSPTISKRNQAQMSQKTTDLSLRITHSTQGYVLDLHDIINIESVLNYYETAPSWMQNRVPKTDDDTVVSVYDRILGDINQDIAEMDWDKPSVPEGDYYRSLPMRDGPASEMGSTGNLHDMKTSNASLVSGSSGTEESLYATTDELTRKIMWVEDPDTGEKKRMYALKTADGNLKIISDIEPGIDHDNPFNLNATDNGLIRRKSSRGRPVIAGALRCKSMGSNMDLDTVPDEGNMAPTDPEEQIVLVIETFDRAQRKSISCKVGWYGEELITKVQQKFDCPGNFPYLGLGFYRPDGAFDRWLDMETTLGQQRVRDRATLTLMMRYWRWPKNLGTNDQIVDIMFGQATRMIIAGLWPVPESVAVRLAGLYMQALLGDHDPSKHGVAQLSLNDIEGCIPHPLVPRYKEHYWLKRLVANHMRHRRMSATEAAMKYLTVARSSLPTWGTTIYQVTCGGSDSIIGVGEDGLIIGHTSIEDSRPGHFRLLAYGRIEEVRANDHGFEIQLKKTFSNELKILKFDCEHKTTLTLIEEVQDYYALHQVEQNPGTVTEDDFPHTSGIAPLSSFDTENPLERIICDPMVSQYDKFKVEYLEELRGREPHYPAVILIDSAIDRGSDFHTANLGGIFYEEAQFAPLLAALRKTWSYAPEEGFDGDPNKPQYIRNMSFQRIVLQHNVKTGTALLSPLATMISSRNPIAEIILTNCGLQEKDARALGILVEGSHRLRSLHVNDNNIGVKGCKAVLESLKANPNLTALNLSNTGASNAVLDAYRKMIKAGETCSLSKLLLNGNKGIGDSGLEAIASVLSSPGCRLHTLAVSNTAITAHSAKIFLDAMLQAGKIRSLEMASTKLSTRTAEKLANVLQMQIDTTAGCRKSNLELATLSEETIKPSTIKKISSLMRGRTEPDRPSHIDKDAGEDSEIDDDLESRNAGDIPLENLDISGTDIGRKGVLILLNALAAASSLKRLHIGNNAFDSACFEALVNALEKNKRIRYLSIAGVTIDGSSAKHVAEALRRNTSLDRLDLSNCELDPTTAKIVLSGLYKNSTLDGVILKKNSRLGNGSIGTVAEFLDRNRNRTLKRLNLDNCSICDVDALRIGEALAINKSLEVLTMRNNMITNKGLVKILEGIIGHPNLTMVKLDFNKFKGDPVILQKLNKIRDVRVVLTLDMTVGEAYH